METTPVTKALAAKAQAGPAGHAKHAGGDPAAPAGSGNPTAAVEIRLSEAGEKAAEAARSGKAEQSPAHQARAFLAERADAESAGGEKIPFGQIVSRIARGIDPEEAFAAPAEDAVEEVAAGDEAPAEEEIEVVEDGAPEPAPTSEPDGSALVGLVAELLDELSDPQEGES
jgi:hypothetical protein